MRPAISTVFVEVQHSNAVAEVKRASHHSLKYNHQLITQPLILFPPPAHYQSNQNRILVLRHHPLLTAALLTELVTQLLGDQRLSPFSFLLYNVLQAPQPIEK